MPDLDKIMGPYVKLDLTKEQYDDLIRATGMKAQAVVACFNEHATWSDEAKAEDPGFDTPDPLAEMTFGLEVGPVQTDLEMGESFQAGGDPEVAPDEITG